MGGREKGTQTSRLVARRFDCDSDETMDHDYAFEIAASAVRFGAGVTREVGSDLADLGATKVLVMSDPTVSRMPLVQAVIESLVSSGTAFALLDRVRLEPADESCLATMAFSGQ